MEEGSKGFFFDSFLFLKTSLLPLICVNISVYTYELSNFCENIKQKRMLASILFSSVKRILVCMVTHLRRLKNTAAAICYVCNFHLAGEGTCIFKYIHS